MYDNIRMRTAYRCRAYPDEAQQQVLTRTFGCVRVVWHQHKAFSAFFARRARYPRFKSRRSRQAAHYTRSAFTMRAGELRLAKTSASLRFVWSWPDVNVTSLNPAMVIVSREPDGRQRAGRELIVVDRWYPSSKTCSACGHLLAELSLSTRHWTCSSCGSRHDRDINAAKNILAAGLAVSACGADVRHSGSSRMRSAVKQEPRPVTAGIPVLHGGE